MIMPRRGDMIDTVPYGRGEVTKILSEGRIVVTIDRMVKTSEGGFTNQIVAELHPVWLALGPALCLWTGGTEK